MNTEFVMIVPDVTPAGDQYKSHRVAAPFSTTPSIVVRPSGAVYRLGETVMPVTVAVDKLSE